MARSESTTRKLEARLADLIKEGELILATGRLVPRDSGTHAGGRYSADERGRHNASEVMEYDWLEFVEWRTNCISLLEMLCDPGSLHHQKRDTFNALGMNESSLEMAIGMLRGLRNDLKAGFLGDLRGQIEGEAGSDLLNTADALLQDGYHGPAGLLAGATFEQAVRWLCAKQVPPLPVTTKDGKPARLDTLIDALRAAKVYTQPVASEAKSWAAIRNPCAHGDFSAVTPEQVRRTIEGVRSFLARYLA